MLVTQRTRHRWYDLVWVIWDSVFITAESSSMNFQYDCIFWLLRPFQEILPVITFNSRGDILKVWMSYERPFEHIFSCFQIRRVDKSFQLAALSVSSVRNPFRVRVQKRQISLEFRSTFTVPTYLNSVIGPWRNGQRQWRILVLPSLLPIPSKPSFLLKMEIDLNTFLLIYKIEDWWGS